MLSEDCPALGYSHQSEALASATVHLHSFNASPDQNRTIVSLVIAVPVVAHAAQGSRPHRLASILVRINLLSVRYFHLDWLLNSKHSKALIIAAHTGTKTNRVI